MAKIVPYKPRTRSAAGEGETSNRRYDKNNITVPPANKKDARPINKLIKQFANKTGAKLQPVSKEFKLIEVDGVFIRVEDDED